MINNWKEIPEVGQQQRDMTKGKCVLIPGCQPLTLQQDCLGLSCLAAPGAAKPMETESCGAERISVGHTCGKKWRAQLVMEASTAKKKGFQSTRLTCVKCTALLF